jgi:hypothetical protein
MLDLDNTITLATTEQMDLDRDSQDLDRDDQDLDMYPGSTPEEAPNIPIHILDAHTPVIVDSDNSDSDDSDSDSNHDQGETPLVQSASGTDPEFRGQGGMFFYMLESPTLMTTC